MTRVERLYSGGCRLAVRFFRFKSPGRAGGGTKKFELAGLEVREEEVEAFAFFAAVCAAIPLIVGVSMGVELSNLTFLFPLPLVSYALVGWYPRFKAEREMVRCSGEVPIFVSYVSMSMRVNPNFERAVIFTAENLDNELGRSLRRSLGRFYLRANSTVWGATSWFADRWKGCGELGRSVSMLKSSESEREDARHRTLDRVLELNLQDMRDRMRGFAEWIRLPTLLIYSMGVLLPLMLVAVLPVLTTVGLAFELPHMFAIYCVVLPVAVYALSRWTLAKRPAGSSPPEVPPGTRRARAVLGASIPAASLVFAGLLTPWVDEVRFLLVLWGMVIGASLYFYLTNAKAFEYRNRAERMGTDFEDALTQLGNLVSEGRPAEEAFERVADTMRGTELSGVFSRASANIRFGGMGLRASLFDPELGALRGVHLKTMRVALGLLVNLIGRSTRVAGGAILRTADHLRKLKRAEMEVRRALGEVVSSMRSVAIFFAPLITSVISRVQGVIASKGEVGFLNFAPVQPAAFLFVLGLYTVLLAAILTLYTTEIEFGDDPPAKGIALAQALPLALAVFTVGAAVSWHFMKVFVN